MTPDQAALRLEALAPREVLECLRVLYPRPVYDPGLTLSHVMYGEGQQSVLARIELALTRATNPEPEDAP